MSKYNKRKKKPVFRLRIKLSENGYCLPTAWETDCYKKAEQKADEHREDPLVQVYCYDLGCAV